MVLPFYLAITEAELAASPETSRPFAWMACHFSSTGQGLSDFPHTLNTDSILIVNDRIPCQGHSPDLVACQLQYVVDNLHCESVLLDFQRPDNQEAARMAQILAHTLSCPVAVSAPYAADLSTPVFLPPCPLHQPLETFLAPWHDREIWIEVSFSQEVLSVTTRGVSCAVQFPPQHLSGGFYHQNLCCRYQSSVQASEVRFTLYDTAESLEQKIEKAHRLGVSRAVGLYQEFGREKPPC